MYTRPIYIRRFNTEARRLAHVFPRPALSTQMAGSRTRVHAYGGLFCCDLRDDGYGDYDSMYDDFM